jgi:hypothetical protein
VLGVGRRFGGGSGGGDDDPVGAERVVYEPGQGRWAAPPPGDDLAQATLVVADLRSQAAHGNTALAHQGAHYLGKGRHVRMPIALGVAGR